MHENGAFSKESLRLLKNAPFLFRLKGYSGFLGSSCLR